MFLYNCCTSFFFRSLPAFVFVTTLAAVGCSSISSPQSPAATLEIPPSFRKELAIHHFARGEKVVDRGFMEMTALASMTRYEGCWGSCRRSGVLGHSSWWIDIYAAGSPRVVAAYARARDGYEANLDEWSDFFSTIEQTGILSRRSRISSPDLSENTFTGEMQSRSSAREHKILEYIFLVRTGFSPIRSGV